MARTIQNEEVDNDVHLFPCSTLIHVVTHLSLVFLATVFEYLFGVQLVTLYGSNFQKACVEEWEQKVHTSDDELQERECHREESNSWF